MSKSPNYKNLQTKPSIPKFVNFKQTKLTTNSAKFLTEQTDGRQKALVANLFSKHGKLKSLDKSLENYSLEELNVLVDFDSPEQRSLYGALDKTETAAGSVVLSALLSNRTSDLSVIKKDSIY